MERFRYQELLTKTRDLGGSLAVEYGPIPDMSGWSKLLEAFQEGYILGSKKVIQGVP
jgi:hypothetical protein